MTLNSGSEVKLLVPGGSGSYKTIDLPATEALRSPDQPVPESQLPRFEEEVVGFVPQLGLVTTNRNQWLSVTCHGTPLQVGQRYAFVDTLKYTTITKTVCHVHTDGDPIQKYQQDAFSLSDPTLDSRQVEHVLRRLGIDPRRFYAEYQREESV
jgi:hypothetical protein